MKQTFKQIMGSTYYFVDDQNDIPKTILEKMQKAVPCDFLNEKFIAACFIDQMGSRGEFFVLVTNDRVISKKAARLEQNYFKDMNGVERSILGDIVLLSPGNKSDCFPGMNMPNKVLLDKMFGIINNHWTHLKNDLSESTSKSINDLPEQIEKLSSLKERGILTEEEFTLKKKQLLGI